MIWQNLAKNKCPKCGSDFTENMQSREYTNEVGERLKIMIHLCGFRISEQKFEEIVAGMVRKQLKQ